MARCIRELCVLSVFCAAAMQLAPEGGVKRVLSVLCTAALFSTALGAIRDIDYTAYALELAKNREREQRFLAESEDMRERLDRLVIAGEYEAYVMDKASQNGLTPVSAEVGLRWSIDGLWVPDSLELHYRGERRQAEKTAAAVTGELGIAPERQRWIDDDTGEETHRDTG